MERRGEQARNLSKLCREKVEGGVVTDLAERQASSFQETLNGRQDGGAIQNRKL